LAENHKKTFLVNLKQSFLPYNFRVKRLWNKNKCGRGLILSVGYWLDGCGLLLA